MVHGAVESAPMMDDRITIKIADNGFMLEYSDPKVVERNRGKDGEWEDPEVNKVYPTADSLVTGVRAALSVVTGDDKADSSAEFEQAFQEASNG